VPELQLASDNDELSEEEIDDVDSEDDADDPDVEDAGAPISAPRTVVQAVAHLDPDKRNAGVIVIYCPANLAVGTRIRIDSPTTGYTYTNGAPFL
jgi:hypothetical protein